jgi:cell division inhibitor SepF
MVYLGLQDDDDYSHDQYGYAPDEDPYAGEEHYGGEGRPAGPGAGGHDYAEIGARGYPETRDVRPVREVQQLPPREHGEPAVRALPRDEPPSGVIVTRPTVVRAVATTAARVHVVEPHGFNDAPEIGDRVKENQAVILNLQGVPRELQRRLIDFSSGLAYAVGGSMSRVADSVFLITPLNVSLSEEEKEKLRGRGLYRRD